MAVLTGCPGSPPREPTPPPVVDTTPAERVVLGGTVEVETSWKQTCSETHITGLKDTSAHDAPGIGLERKTTTWDCKQQTFHVDVSCEERCEADEHDAAFTGASAVRVRMTTLGATTVHLEVIHAQTNEHRSKDKRVEVVLPDAFSARSA